MNRRLHPRRRRAALITLGLVSAASVGTLRPLSVAEARNTAQGAAQQEAKPAAKRTAAKPASKSTASKTAAKPAAKATAATAAAAATPAQLADGKQVYAMTCAACHQATGLGVEGTYPPLAASEWVTGDEGKLVRIILHGMTGPIEVAGETYSGAMPPWGGVLKDADVAAVSTYIRNSWGNKAAAVATAKVASIRSATTARKTPWTAAELAQVPAGK